MARATTATAAEEVWSEVCLQLRARAASGVSLWVRQEPSEQLQGGEEKQEEVWAVQCFEPGCQRCFTLPQLVQMERERVERKVAGAGGRRAAAERRKKRRRRRRKARERRRKKLRREGGVLDQENDGESDDGEAVDDEDEDDGESGEEAGDDESEEDEVAGTAETACVEVRFHPGAGCLDVRCMEHAQIPMFCTCKRPYDSTLAMVACDDCSDWFHNSCVGLPDSAELPEFVCATCTDRRLRGEPTPPQLKEDNQRREAISNLIIAGSNFLYHLYNLTHDVCPVVDCIAAGGVDDDEEFELNNTTLEFVINSLDPEFTHPGMEHPVGVFIVCFEGFAELWLGRVRQMLAALNAWEEQVRAFCRDRSAGLPDRRLVPPESVADAAKIAEPLQQELAAVTTLLQRELVLTQATDAPAPITDATSADDDNEPSKSTAVDVDADLRVGPFSRYSEQYGPALARVHSTVEWLTNSVQEILRPRPRMHVAQKLLQTIPLHSKVGQSDLPDVVRTALPQYNHTTTAVEPLLRAVVSAAAQLAEELESVVSAKKIAAPDRARALLQRARDSAYEVAVEARLAELVDAAPDLEEQIFLVGQSEFTDPACVASAVETSSTAPHTHAAAVEHLAPLVRTIQQFPLQLRGEDALLVVLRSLERLALHDRLLQHEREQKEQQLRNQQTNPELQQQQDVRPPLSAIQALHRQMEDDLAALPAANHSNDNDITASAAFATLVQRAEAWRSRLQAACNTVRARVDAATSVARDAAPLLRLADSDHDGAAAAATAAALATAPPVSEVEAALAKFSEVSVQTGEEVLLRCRLAALRAHASVSAALKQLDEGKAQSEAELRQLCNDFKEARATTDEDVQDETTGAELLSEEQQEAQQLWLNQVVSSTQFRLADLLLAVDRWRQRANGLLPTDAHDTPCGTVEQLRALLHDIERLGVIVPEMELLQRTIAEGPECDKHIRSEAKFADLPREFTTEEVEGLTAIAQHADRVPCSQHMRAIVATKQHLCHCGRWFQQLASTFSEFRAAEEAKAGAPTATDTEQQQQQQQQRRVVAVLEDAVIPRLGAMQDDIMATIRFTLLPDAATESSQTSGSDGAAVSAVVDTAPWGRPRELQDAPELAALVVTTGVMLRSLQTCAVLVEDLEDSVRQAAKAMWASGMVVVWNIDSCVLQKAKAPLTAFQHLLDVLPHLNQQSVASYPWHEQRVQELQSTVDSVQNLDATVRNVVLAVWAAVTGQDAVRVVASVVSAVKNNSRPTDFSSPQAMRQCLVYAQKEVVRAFHEACVHTMEQCTGPVDACKQVAMRIQEDGLVMPTLTKQLDLALDCGRVIRQATAMAAKMARCMDQAVRAFDREHPGAAAAAAEAAGTKSSDDGGNDADNDDDGGAGGGDMPWLNGRVSITALKQALQDLVAKTTALGTFAGASVPEQQNSATMYMAATLQLLSSEIDNWDALSLVPLLPTASTRRRAAVRTLQLQSALDVLNSMQCPMSRCVISENDLVLRQDVQSAEDWRAQLWHFLLPGPPEVDPDDENEDEELPDPQFELKQARRLATEEKRLKLLMEDAAVLRWAQSVLETISELPFGFLLDDMEQALEDDRSSMSRDDSNTALVALRDALALSQPVVAALLHSHSLIATLPKPAEGVKASFSQDCHALLRRAPTVVANLEAQQLATTQFETQLHKTVERARDDAVSEDPQIVAAARTNLQELLARGERMWIRVSESARTSAEEALELLAPVTSARAAQRKQRAGQKRKQESASTEPRTQREREAGDNDGDQSDSAPEDIEEDVDTFVRRRQELQRKSRADKTSDDEYERDMSGSDTSSESAEEGSDQDEGSDDDYVDERTLDVKRGPRKRKRADAEHGPTKKPDNKKKRQQPQKQKQKQQKKKKKKSNTARAPILSSYVPPPELPCAVCGRNIPVEYREHELEGRCCSEECMMRAAVELCDQAQILTPRLACARVHHVLFRDRARNAASILSTEIDAATSPRPHCTVASARSVMASVLQRFSMPASVLPPRGIGRGGGAGGDGAGAGADPGGDRDGGSKASKWWFEAPGYELAPGAAYGLEQPSKESASTFAFSRVLSSLPTVASSMGVFMPEMPIRRRTRLQLADCIFACLATRMPHHVPNTLHMFTYACSTEMALYQKVARKYEDKGQNTVIKTYRTAYAAIRRMFQDDKNRARHEEFYSDSFSPAKLAGLSVDSPGELLNPELRRMKAQLIEEKQRDARRDLRVDEAEHLGDREMAIALGEGVREPEAGGTAQNGRATSAATNADGSQSSRNSGTDKLGSQATRRLPGGRLQRPTSGSSSGTAEGQMSRTHSQDEIALQQARRSANADAFKALIGATGVPPALSRRESSSSSVRSLSGMRGSSMSSTDLLTGSTASSSAVSLLPPPPDADSGASSSGAVAAAAPTSGAVVVAPQRPAGRASSDGFVWMTDLRSRRDSFTFVWALRQGQGHPAAGTDAFAASLEVQDPRQYRLLPHRMEIAGRVRLQNMNEFVRSKLQSKTSRTEALLVRLRALEPPHQHPRALELFQNFRKHHLRGERLALTHGYDERGEMQKGGGMGKYTLYLVPTELANRVHVWEQSPLLDAARRRADELTMLGVLLIYHG